MKSKSNKSRKTKFKKEPDHLTNTLFAFSSRAC
jgi:hypothetical protein